MIWKAIISGVIGGGLISSFIALFALYQIIKRNTREAFFKCLEGYFKVMEYKSEAITSKKYSAYFFYYRALLDLQWSEYQMWLRNSIPDAPYRIWLELRNKQYNGTPKNCVDDLYNSEKKIGYKVVWEKLLQEGYYSVKDPFVEHMNLVHHGKLDVALDQKYSKYKHKLISALFRRFNK